jgi:phage tail sheath gpL-like
VTVTETLSKLRPDRALELGFFSQPSATAALHSTSANTWTLSGTWRQQHDYAIVEYSKYNRWDHPRLRYLPDGDLSGITLQYDERRIGTQPMESDAFAYTDWPWLLVTANDAGGNEQLYRVRLRDYAALVSGSLAAASASFTVGGTVAVDDVISVTIMTEKYAYQVGAGDTLGSIAAGIAAAVNTGGSSRLCEASSSGATVTLTARSAGIDGNRVGYQGSLYHFAAKASGRLSYSGTVQQSPPSTAGGTVNGREYSVSAWPNEVLDDLIYRLALQMQADPDVDVSWTAGGIINIAAKIAGAAGNSITLSASGSNGVSGTVSQAMSGGRDEGNGGLVTITPASGLLTGGDSESATWRVTLDFASLVDKDDASVPTADVRRLRWVYSPPLQVPLDSDGNPLFNGDSAFQPAEFSIQVTNWTVSGSGTGLKVAGPVSQRIEDDDERASYTGSWGTQTGNVSGETMHYSTAAGAQVVVTYRHPCAHHLYLGTQRTYDSAIARVQVDGDAPFTLDLYTPGSFPGDIFLARERLAVGLGPGEHTIRITHTGTRNGGSSGWFFYFDFLEAAAPADVPDAPEVHTDTGLATDYDTAALWLSPERLAWSIDKLGLKGELNHFAGVEFFYEKQPTGWTAGSATVEAGDTVTPGDWVQITIGESAITHSVAYGDTLESIATGLAMAVNAQTSVWAQASGAVVIIHARVPGTGANSITLATSTSGGATETLTASGTTLSGGVDGAWETDGAASPILNRAARDWHQALAAALSARSIPLRIALSMELKHAPTSWGQQYSDGAVVITSNGTVQTSPSSPSTKAFWKECYKAFAALMNDAGITPHLQFGEVQWWYAAGGSPASMAYYDPTTKADFQAEYGRPLHVFTAPSDDPSINSYEDASFLRDRLGAFCADVQAHVLASYPTADFEVLWPRDVNDPTSNPLNYYVNLPVAAWSPASMAKFKTEAFQEAYPQRNMEKVRTTVRFPMTTLGFSRQNTRHLVGAMANYPWERERQAGLAEGIGLTTLWAWDQFCSIGRRVPLPEPRCAAQFVGA